MFICFRSRGYTLPIIESQTHSINANLSQSSNFQDGGDSRPRVCHEVSNVMDRLQTQRWRVRCPVPSNFFVSFLLFFFYYSINFTLDCYYQLILDVFTQKYSLLKLKLAKKWRKIMRDLITMPIPQILQYLFLLLLT